MKMNHLFLVSISLIVLSCDFEQLHTNQPIIECNIKVEIEVQNNNCKAPCEIIFINNSRNANEFYWDFGDGNTSSSVGSRQTHTYNNAGTYKVTLTAQFGDCKEEDFLFVTVEILTFDTIYGTAGNDEGNSVIETSDGSYLLLGTTDSAGRNDFYLIKTVGNGKQLWREDYGGPYSDEGNSVIETSDGSYLLLGTTDSEGAGGSDFYLIKTDNSGKELWREPYGGPDYDLGNSVIETSDGGYLLLGSTFKGVGKGSFYLVKTDMNGKELWSKPYPEFIGGNSVIETSDGGYLLLGSTLCVECGGNLDYNVYLIKTDTSGKELWREPYGGPDYDLGNSVIETSDGGYLLLGLTYSKGAGKGDVYLIKTDTSGKELWCETYGGPDYDEGNSVIETSDGSYLLLGTTSSEGEGGRDVYLIKIDRSRKELWNKTYGGFGNDEGNSVIETSDGSYLLLGTTYSEETRRSDFFLIKTDENGNIQE